MATKFKTKWMMLHQEEMSANPTHKDDSLTSLQWLQGFSIPGSDAENATGSGCKQQQLVHVQPQGTGESPASPTATSSSPGTACSTPSSDSCSPLQMESPGDSPSFSLADRRGGKIDYKTNQSAKPPYSYVSLIFMAMQESRDGKVTLSTIYNWISENFCYYRHADPSWQNSIRHNLSLNKCFMKVPRQMDDEPGKGGFWQLDPEHADMFANGTFKRRRAPVYGTAPKLSKSLPNAQESRGMGYIWKRNPRKPSKSQTKVEKSPLGTQETTTTTTTPAALAPWASSDTCDDDRRRQAYDDLELNAALRSLSKEMEDFQQPQQQQPQPQQQQGWQVAGHGGNWYVASPAEVSPVVEASPVAMAEYPAVYHHQHQQQLYGVQISGTPQQYYGELTLLADQQQQQQQHYWNYMREEMQAVPVTVPTSVSLVEGVYYDMQSWDRVNPYVSV